MYVVSRAPVKSVEVLGFVNSQDLQGKNKVIKITTAGKTVSQTSNNL